MKVESPSGWVTSLKVKEDRAGSTISVTAK